MTWQLRPATADDLPQIARIEQAAHRHPWTAPMLAAELENSQSRLVVAVGAGQAGQAAVIVGYMVSWLVADELHVQNVATDPAFRRQGVGRALMAEAEGYALARGAQLATLEVRPSNTEARALYASFGYEQVGRRRGYYQEDGEDALVLVRTFPAAQRGTPL